MLVLEAGVERVNRAALRSGYLGIIWFLPWGELYGNAVHEGKNGAISPECNEMQYK